MTTRINLFLTLFVLLPVCLFATINVGDLVETRGPVSGIWFPGKVVSMRNGKYNVISFGWEKNGPKEVESSFIRPITANSKVIIRKGGSVWAEVSPDGTVRIGGSIVGSIDGSNTVRKGGSIVGSIEMNGEIWKNGSMCGSVWPSGEIYANGSIVGNISNQDGTIRKDGSIWGTIESFSRKFREMRIALAMLAFFSDEFGY
jgi:cytoskeletal protein CcmA (bactofilin family)